jgi:predicted dinucleotide-binding enzyme
MAVATIFGTGKMGAAIASIFEAGGTTVDRINTSSVHPVIQGDIVVLAVPYASIGSIVKAYAEELAGRIVIDISNPIDRTTFEVLTPEGSSSAEELFAALPGSDVVKAFNTSFAATLISKHLGPNTTTVLIAGDDASSKHVVMAAVRAAGLDVIDCGVLSRARDLEAIGRFQRSLAAFDTISWTGGFALVR